MALLNVKVVPNASRTRFVGRFGDGVKVQVAAPPEGGKANDAVIRLLADTLQLAIATIQIRRGHTQARKTIEIIGWSDADLTAWLTTLEKT